MKYSYISGFGEHKVYVQVLANSLLLLEIVLLAYDSLLTLFEEVPYIWQKKWKLGTVLYLLARYAALQFITIEMIFSLNSISLRVCFVHYFYWNAYII